MRFRTRSGLYPQESGKGTFSGREKFLRLTEGGNPCNFSLMNVLSLRNPKKS